MTYCKLISYMFESFLAAGITTALFYTILFFSDCFRIPVRKWCPQNFILPGFQNPYSGSFKNRFQVSFYIKGKLCSINSFTE